jgi:hypothetical protein
MSQEATTIPPKGLGSLSLNDFWKSLLLAALTNVLLELYTIIQSGNWPTHADLITMTKTTFAIILSYLLKNLGTNNAGQLLKKDVSVVSVPATQAAAANIPPVSTTANP